MRLLDLELRSAARRNRLERGRPQRRLRARPRNAEWRYDGKVSRYEGDLRDGRLHGGGVYAAADFSRHEGEFRDDRADGFGEFRARGGRFVGTWVDGCFREGSKRASVNRPLPDRP